jgi:hypothetical protein
MTEGPGSRPEEAEGTPRLALLGLFDSFRMMRLPDRAPSGAVEEIALA